MVTPIYQFIKKYYSSAKSWDEMVKSDEFKEYFGENQFSLESTEEV